MREEWVHRGADTDITYSSQFKCISSILESDTWLCFRYIQICWRCPTPIDLKPRPETILNADARWWQILAVDPGTPPTCWFQCYCYMVRHWTLFTIILLASALSISINDFSDFSLQILTSALQHYALCQTSDYLPLITCRGSPLSDVSLIPDVEETPQVSDCHTSDIDEVPWTSDCLPLIICRENPSGIWLSHLRCRRSLLDIWLPASHHIYVEETPQKSDCLPHTICRRIPPPLSDVSFIPDVEEVP